jgi:hypothetical protein
MKRIRCSDDNDEGSTHAFGRHLPAALQGIGVLLFIAKTLRLTQIMARQRATNGKHPIVSQ